MSLVRGQTFRIFSVKLGSHLSFIFGYFKAQTLIIFKIICKIIFKIICKIIFKIICKIIFKIIFQFEKMAN